METGGFDPEKRIALRVEEAGMSIRPSWFYVAARVVLESVQGMLLKLALQMARDDYETRRER